MKFLVFNLVVVAALGYIFYERGDFDGTKVAALFEDAKSYAASDPGKDSAIVEEPVIAAEPVMDAQIPEQAEPPQIPQEPGPETLAEVFTPPPENPPALAPLEEVEVAPVILKKPLPPEVEERRSIVLGTGTAPAFQSADTSANRTERLRDLAEEMEFLSVDLIYQ